MIEIDPPKAHANLGMHIISQPMVGAPEDARTPWTDDVLKVQLEVPQNPSALDFARAYADQLRKQAEIAEEAVLDAELNAANAERIAAGTRLKALRLREQEQAMLAQIELLSKLDNRVV